MGSRVVRSHRMILDPTLGKIRKIVRTMSKYQEIPRIVDAVCFEERAYGETPFAFFDELSTPEWIDKLVKGGKLVPFFSPDTPFWRYNFFHEDMTLVIEPHQWFVYNENHRRNHQPQYQIMSDEAFKASYQSAVSIS